MRHGQTDWNAQGRVQGHTPTALNAAGMEEARRLAAHFAGRPFSAVVSSDLPRAAQTAQAIADRLHLPVELTPQLRERSFGPYEGMFAPELAAARRSLGLPLTGDLADWTGMPDIESTDSVWNRASTCLRDLSIRFGAGSGASGGGDGGGDVVVVTHGGIIARVVYRLLGIPEGAPRRFALSNGIVAIIEYREPIFWLLSLADLPLIYTNHPSPDTATTPAPPTRASPK